jgi:hypothetical protein
MALQQGEKDIDQITAQNEGLAKRRSALLGQVLTAQGRIDAKEAGKKAQSLFGTSREGLQLQTISQLAPLYAAGSLLPQEERDFLIQVEDYTQERKTRYNDPETGLLKEEISRKKLPSFVMDALAKRPPGGPGASGSTPALTPPPSTGTAKPSSAPLGVTSTNVAPDVFQVASVAPKSTFFDLAGTGTGFVPVLVAGVARNVPIDAAGKIAPDFQVSTAMLELMTNRVVNVLQENPRFPEGERKQILSELRTAPRVFSNKSGYINQIIAVDNVVEGLQKRQEAIRDEPKTGIPERQNAIKKLEDITSIRELFGIQSRTITDPKVWKTLPPGDYVVINPQTGLKEVRPKY